jgi:hypothetical protein
METFGIFLVLLWFELRILRLMEGAKAHPWTICVCRPEPTNWLQNMDSTGQIFLRPRYLKWCSYRLFLALGLCRDEVVRGLQVSSG